MSRKGSPGTPRQPVSDAWGVDDGYEDARGQWRDTSASTRDAIVRAMGGDPEAVAPAAPSVQVIIEGESPSLGPGDVQLEDGETRAVSDGVPVDLPPGYHWFRDRAGAERRLIVAPRACHAPPRMWGWAVQLYSARSAGSWGIGDLADLRALAGWARSLGAGFLLVNPLGATTPVTPQEPSPYFPSSRRFKSVLYLRLEDVPGFGEHASELAALADAARALNAESRIDRDAVLGRKMEGLARLWAHFDTAPAFDAYRREMGTPLEEFATFCALAERHGKRWRTWPEEFRHPASPAVREFASAEATRVRYHAWTQWLLDMQFARASGALPAVQDLAIGVDPDGADAWAWQDLLAQDVEVGAPPDLYNQLGQAWGLPPFVPHKLAAAGYDPFIQTLRMILRQAGGLRIDHVMGLFRLFWIPNGVGPADGAFVRYPAADLMAIVCLESQRAGAFVVGEDLGTVEEAARRQLDAAGILSYRLLWFETAHPRSYPERALAAVTTHDLPTIRGLWSGEDARTQRRLGLAPNERGYREMRRRLAAMAGLSRTATIERVIDRLHRLLGGARSRLRTATLEDALAVAQRPNMPGADPSWPNWSSPLPEPIEALETNQRARAIASALGGAAGDGRRRRSRELERPGGASAPRRRAGTARRLSRRRTADRGRGTTAGSGGASAPDRP